VIGGEARKTPGAGSSRAGLAVLTSLLLLAVSLPGAAARLSFPEDDPFEIVASKGGFEPAVLRMRKGETIRISLTTADEEHCFAVDALRVEKRVVPGKPTIFELTADRAGSFPYYCCLEPDETEEKPGRLIVSE
jgi:heme/copper-type cytochrome/quinol oxidase subunit 2